MDELYTVLFDFATNIISSMGYFGVYLGMVIDASGFPIPSQAVMGFAGYMVYTGQLNIFLAALAGSLGNTTGGIVIYLLSKKYGRSFVKRFGKYIKYTEKDLEESDKWFKKWGDELVLFAQLVPGLRTVISVPAGVWKVKPAKFVPYLFIGTYIYGFIMTFLGYKFGANWERIGYYIDTFENISYAIMAIILGYLVYRYVKKKNFFKKA